MDLDTPAVNWQTLAPDQPSPQSTLADSSLHLWRIDLTDGADGPFWGCLSEDEVARAQRYRFDRDRTRFVQSRGSLRHILSRYLNQPPATITFTYGPYGKPSCTAAIGTGLSFNLSHSGDVALCALTRHRRVGIDVEQYREITHFDSLARRCLTAAEIPTLEQLPMAQRQPIFLQYWTAKEAYLKAIGCGLTQSLTSVSLQLAPPKLISVPESGNWILQLFALDGAAAAVVVEGKTENSYYLLSK
ncbi:MAG: 4'-phosphopantetheinyl transferase superfamily protein [Cyanobacteria bacterium J06632_22]